MTILITGGCGFIGSHLIDFLIEQDGIDMVLNLDCLSYAADKSNNWLAEANEYYEHHQVDIRNWARVLDIFERFQPDWVFHLAAETHVDNSIREPQPFIETNVLGTYNLLHASHRCGVHRFLHVSTDEVYGSMHKGRFAYEDYPFKPSSPYSASKASGDLLVQSWIKTYQFPALIVRPSNCYGPRQHAEKLIPKAILNCLTGKPIPLYGDGLQMREWIYVDDLIRGIWLIMNKGNIGEAYNLGGIMELTNLQLVRRIQDLIGEPTVPITHVPDRPGHDRRYATANAKAVKLGFERRVELKTGLDRTIEFYRQKLEKKPIDKPEEICSADFARNVGSP